MITMKHLDHYYYPLHTNMAKLIVGFCNFPLRTHEKGKVFKQRLFPCSGTTETWSEKSSGNIPRGPATDTSNIQRTLKLGPTFALRW
jgi:hypothetical protein